MAQHTEGLTIELVTEELSTMSVSDPDSGGTQFDSLLSIANASTAKDPADGVIDKSAAKNLPSSLRVDGSNDRSPFLPPPGVIIGKLVNVNPRGVAEVDFPGNALPKPLCARTAISLEVKHNNQEVVLMFENGDFTKPIILGVLQPQEGVPQLAVNQDSPKIQNPLSVQIDEDRLTFTAKKELVLRCGKASITLTRAGKILIRGAYLLSRSSGVNCVKGGSVQIN